MGENRPCASCGLKECRHLANDSKAKSETELSAIRQTSVGQTQPAKPEAPVSIFPEVKEK
jgi:hypothetical protein